MDPSTKEQIARILVMVDEEIVCAVVADMLIESGFSAETARDSKQAIEKYKQSMDAGQPFNCVIIDLTIPGEIGGKEAVKDILEIDPEARSLFPADRLLILSWQTMLTTASKQRVFTWLGPAGDGHYKIPLGAFFWFQ